jgi:hypothetical protein
MVGNIDGYIFSDASDTGVGAVLFTEGPEAAASSLVAALAARAPPGLARAAIVRQARQGFEFIAPLPAHMLSASSTLREMYGIWLFVSAVCALLRAGRHLAVLDNLGCVLILGGIVPEFARGGKAWGEFSSGGSPQPELQRMAIAIADMQEQGDFTLIPVWRPREENVRADFLSRVSQLQLHDYRLRPAWFRLLDEMWGPHSIDRFATADSCQQLRGRFAGRFCSLFFHPDAVWTDAFASPWGDENNWLFPPFEMVGQTVCALRGTRARGTLLIPMDRSASWWPLVRSGLGWARDIAGSFEVGPISRVVSHFHAQTHGLQADFVLWALRFEGRRPSVVEQLA